MKRWVVSILFILVAILGFLVVIIKPYYTPAAKQEGLRIAMHNDDTIRISYIGDSWIEGYLNVDCVVDSLVSNVVNRPVVVRKAGISGLTSKYIYNCIFMNESFREVIEWGPKFCFVVAGINDSDRKMGAGYYKENMKLIIDLLLDHNITPIILEIPSYNIEFSYERRNRQVKMQYLLSMLLTWSRMDCINEYRDAYNSLLYEHKWEDKVITIRNDDWNPLGYKDNRNLYDEGQMHLNEKGYFVLDSCIATKIVMQLTDWPCNGNH